VSKWSPTNVHDFNNVILTIHPSITYSGNDDKIFVDFLKGSYLIKFVMADLAMSMVLILWRILVRGIQSQAHSPSLKPKQCRLSVPTSKEFENL
jgi:hypothetical protein